MSIMPMSTDKTSEPLSTLHSGTPLVSTIMGIWVILVFEIAESHAREDRHSQIYIHAYTTYIDQVSDLKSHIAAGQQAQQELSLIQDQHDQLQQVCINVIPARFVTTNID